MSKAKIWDAHLYDNQMDFVSMYGKSVLHLLNPGQGETILDLGCGTGDLAKEMADHGADIIGLDSSEAMIEKAKQKYPDLTFILGNAETLGMDAYFDAIFSNAVLHWIKEADKVADSVWKALKPGGRFVAEFGGKGNVETIVNSIMEVLHERGIDAAVRNPFYFPSIGEYASLLERQGFRVNYAIHFDRPTPLGDGENGMRHWLNQFGNHFFVGLNEQEKEAAYKKIMDKLRPALFQDGTWVADYKRIRVTAVKEMR